MSWGLPGRKDIETGQVSLQLEVTLTFAVRYRNIYLTQIYRFIAERITVVYFCF